MSKTDKERFQELRAMFVSDIQEFMARRVIFTFAMPVHSPLKQVYGNISIEQLADNIASNGRRLPKLLHKALIFPAG